MRNKNYIRKSVCVFVIWAICLFLPTSAEAKTTNKKAVAAYKKYLEKNVSSFVELEGDFYTRNGESSNKCSAFMVLDMDKNGTPELVTYHLTAYKQGHLNIYTYKKGKVTAVKKKNNKKAKISENSNAAGWYYTYSCTKGHLHVRWNGGMQGSKETVYVLKARKLNTYLYANEDNLAYTSVYKINGKNVDSSKYYSVYNKCKESKTRIMRENTAVNRSKYVK